MNSTCELGRHAARALKPYPDYKDSGVPWLGEVPKHWEVLPNRALFAEVKERDHPEEQMLSVTITRGVIRQQALLVDSSKKDSSNQDKSAYKLVRPGDIAYNKMRAWQGSVGVSGYQGIVSPAYVVERPRDGTDSRYLHYLLRTPAFSKEAERWSYGITSDMWSLRPEHFKMIYGCLPPLPEQAAIVRFLDHADRRIRRYIRAQQQLITLLEEQKQAVIHRAVTRGLDPNVRLKSSGVEWLGDVPAHWQVRRLRYLIKGRLTYGANAAAEHTDPAWPRYLRITDFSKNGTLRKDTFRSLPPQTAKDYLVEPGDVLLARSGATVGKAFLVGEAAGVACHAGYLIRVRLNRSILHPAFFFAFTQSAAFAMWKDATFIIATIQNIGADRYADLSVPVPPISEQELLLRFLDESTADIDRAVERAEVEMALLREYRTRLIADVVTGKLDVREAAARLPDEVEELEPLDEADALIDGEEEPTDALATVP